MENAVEIKDLHKSFKKLKVLNGINLNVKKGTILGSVVQEMKEILVQGLAKKFVFNISINLTYNKIKRKF